MLCIFILITINYTVYTTNIVMEHTKIIIEAQGTVLEAQERSGNTNITINEKYHNEI